MCDFTTATPKQVPPAPNQRVNYPLGLVLGADEFEQEQAYFLERDRQHNRAGHGYGTVCGLNLSVSDTQVMVSPGLAIDPRGRVIVVCKEQCGDVDKWLSVADNVALLGTGSGNYSLYVTLCYRECLTNKVPIPGAPCRSEEDTMDYSRVTESFSLEFHVDPPPAVEGDVVRSFAQLLAQIQVTDAGAAFLDEGSLADLVRGLLDTSPLSSPPGGPLLLRPVDAERVLRTAFRVWVSEVRPVLHARCDEVAQDSSVGDCILLGRVDFKKTSNKVDTGATVNDPKLTLLQDDRPFLLHTQLLQELILEAFSGLSLGLISLAGDVTGTVGMNTVEKIRGSTVSVAAPAEGQMLLFKGGQWQPDVLPAVSLAGDVAGSANATKVQKIRGKTVAATAPVEGQVLTFSGGQWMPVSLPPYNTIAAGILSVAGNRKPVFGAGLKLVQVLDTSKKPVAGSLLIQFTGYKLPTSKFTYLVKAMAVCDDNAKSKLKLVSPMVNFDQFVKTGIQIWVTDGGTPIAPKFLGQMEFVIEIGQYQSP